MSTIAKCNWATNRLAEVNLECAARAIAACASALSSGLKLERAEAAAPKVKRTVAFVQLTDGGPCALRMLGKLAQKIVGGRPLLPATRVELWSSVAVGLCMKRRDKWSDRAPRCG